MDRCAKPLVIPVFIPHSGCPHQCAFCNQTLITRTTEKIPDHQEICRTVLQYLSYQGQRKSVELAFFGGNFLGLSKQVILDLLDQVHPFVQAGKIHGIRFSTRPDTITPERLDLLKPYAISAIELGVQSMNDRVLAASRRGHTGADTRRAVRLLKETAIPMGIQVMVGLPEDSEETLMESTRSAAGLAPDFARIYPLLVLEGSRVAAWYKTGQYTPLTLAQAVRLTRKMADIFTAARVDVIRMGLQASDMMDDSRMVLAGPWHPAFGHLVLSEQMLNQVQARMDAWPDPCRPRDVLLKVHPHAVSRLRGDKNSNFKHLAQRYPGAVFTVQTDDTLPMGLVTVCENPQDPGKEHYEIF